MLLLLVVLLLLLFAFVGSWDTGADSIRLHTQTFSTLAVSLSFPLSLLLPTLVVIAVVVAVAVAAVVVAAAVFVAAVFADDNGGNNLRISL